MSDLGKQEFGRWIENIPPITDEFLRERGYKEYAPGYFENDPRYSIAAEDRYLLDHPNPPKRLGKLPPRVNSTTTRGPAWDEAQFNGVDGWPTISEDLRKTHHRLDTRRLTSPRVDDAVDTVAGRTTDLWLCLVCRKTFALYPSEKAWRREIFGLRLRIVFRQPIACLNCRAFRQKEVQALGHEGYRDLWSWMFALVQDDGFEIVSRTRLGQQIYRIHRWRKHALPRKLRRIRGYFVRGA